MPLVTSWIYLLVLLVSTILNPENPARFNFKAVGGHLYWSLLPGAVVLAQPPLGDVDWRRLLRVAAAAAAVLGLFALSQAIWGWRLVGSHFEAGDTRAQGLYSHPMTFAYVCLVLWPLGAVGVCKRPRWPEAWILMLAIALGIFASLSHG